RIGAMAGPALPADLAAGQFSSMVIASRFDEVLAEGRRLLNAPPILRVYTSHDVIGVELAAAMSGALAIGVGPADARGRDARGGGRGSSRARSRRARRPGWRPIRSRPRSDEDRPGRGDRDGRDDRGRVRAGAGGVGGGETGAIDRDLYARG